MTRTYQLGVNGHALTVDAEEIVAYERIHNPVTPSVGHTYRQRANLVNPQRFVLGDSVTKAVERFRTVIRRVAHGTALPGIHFDIVPAALGNHAPLWVRGSVGRGVAPVKARS